MAVDMAKTYGDAHTSYLFPELGRKHRQLFIPRRLTQVVFALWEQVKGSDAAMLEQAKSRLNHWADMAAKGALAQKETSLDAEFLRILFAEGLGYVSRGSSTDAFQLDRQFTVAGCGTADGALGFFGVGKQPRPVAVIECKDASVDLDHDKSNGRTPVQQLWDYLAQLPDTPWGILSNYVTVRLYHRDATPRAYHEWTIKDFRDMNRVKEFAYLLGPDGLLGKPPLQKPRASAMLELSAAKQREVGDDLYNYYSTQREILIGILIAEHRYTTDDAIRAAQLLLDRVVFIAFCEDRGLLPAELLKNTWANVPYLSRAGARWRNFLDLFHFIDRGHPRLDLKDGYNGGLFKHDTLVDDLQLDDEPATEVFKNIGEYDFSEQGEVSVDVLGHLFEKSITELEKKKAVGLFGPQAAAAAVQMPKSAERKRFGIYYTPPQFTRLIVDKTLGRLLEERVEIHDDPLARIAAIRKLRVVDPACGSGAFLIAAYERLEDAYDSALHLLRVAGRAPEAADIAKHYPDWILADNLFGMDLSEEAVEITRLALWIRSARKGVALSDLSHNVICGNSLVADPSVHARAKVWADAFPAIFADGGGFDCVIGNPPWERLKLQEREFFALSAMEIAGAVNAADRRKLIEKLETQAPELWRRYNDAKAASEKTLAYVRDCGRFPQTGRGDVNTYMLFAELSRQLVAPDGLIGLLVPSGIATDDTTKHFFGDLMEKKALRALYDFENKNAVFADVHRAFKFSVLLMNGRDRQTEAADFVFFAHSLEDLDPRDRHITLTARDLKLLNPNTRTCPIFRSRYDCELTKRIYRNVPILVDRSRKTGGNPWDVKFVRMLDQTNDAELFRDAKTLEGEGFQLDGNRWVRRKEVYLPLYEAKMVQGYDHRAASVIVQGTNWMRQGQTEETSLVYHQNPEFVAMSRFWVAEKEVRQILDGKGEFPAFLGFKDITSPTNQRTMIASAIPFSAVTNHFPLLLSPVPWRRQMGLLANLNSFVFDYLTRQKIGGITLNFFIVEQLPTFPPEKYDEKCPWDKKQTLEKWISDRVLKLTCTADDMRPLADAAGFKEGVHKWNDAERAQLRAELDAAYFLLYGFTRDEINDVLNGFNGVMKEDEAHGGPGQTRSAILAAFDELGEH